MPAKITHLTAVLIDALTSELRLAHVMDGVLVEVHIHRSGGGCQAGDIILGRVKAVVPGVRGAFVDIGDKLPAGNKHNGGDRRPGGEARDGFLPFADKDTKPPVSEGEAVIVQIRNEAMADKGARLTTNLSLTGRYAVYTPSRPGINVSRKGNDAELTDRFRKLAGANCEAGDGVIVRTASLQMGEAACAPFAEEVSSLREQWLAAYARQSQLTPPAVLVAAPDPLAATLLAIDAAAIERIVVEGSEAWQQIQKQAPPELVGLLSQHKGPAPLFEAFGVEQQLDAALGTEVTLPSGGRLHVAVTPACITIDVDSAGASTGGNRHDVIRTCNQEAATAIARQLRLRNLAGNIVVDFISSKNRDDGHALLDQLRHETADDPVPVEIKGFSRLGFVEMVRRRRSASLAQILCVPALFGGEARGWPGAIKSPVTIAYAALRRAHAEGRNAPGRAITVRAHAGVISVLEGDLAGDVTGAQETRGCGLILMADDAKGFEDLDVYADA